MACHNELFSSMTYLALYGMNKSWTEESFYHMQSFQIQIVPPYLNSSYIDTKMINPAARTPLHLRIDDWKKRRIYMHIYQKRHLCSPHIRMRLRTWHHGRMEEAMWKHRWICLFEPDKNLKVMITSEDKFFSKFVDLLGSSQMSQIYDARNFQLSPEIQTSQDRLQRQGWSLRPVAVPGMRKTRTNRCYGNSYSH